MAAVVVAPAVAPVVLTPVLVPTVVIRRQTSKAPFLFVGKGPFVVAISKDAVGTEPPLAQPACATERNRAARRRGEGDVCAKEKRVRVNPNSFPVGKELFVRFGNDNTNTPTVTATFIIVTG